MRPISCFIHVASQLELYGVGNHPFESPLLASGTLRYLSLHSHSLRKVQGCRAHPARIFVICSRRNRANPLSCSKIE
jgi:hypothetical protein